MLFLVSSAGSVLAFAQSPLEFSCSTFPKDLTEAVLMTRFGTMQQVVSSKEFSSGHPAMQKLNPRLFVITIEYSN